MLDDDLLSKLGMLGQSDESLALLLFLADSDSRRAPVRRVRCARAGALPSLGLALP